MMQRGTLAARDWLRRGAVLVGRVRTRLFADARGLALLDTDTLLVRGLGKTRAGRLREAERRSRATHERIAEDVFRRASAHALRLGERHRAALYSRAVTGVLVPERLAQEERELLQSKKTPL